MYPIYNFDSQAPGGLPVGWYAPGLFAVNSEQSHSAPNSAKISSQYGGTNQSWINNRFTFWIRPTGTNSGSSYCWFGVPNGGSTLSPSMNGRIRFAGNNHITYSSGANLIGIDTGLLYNADQFYKVEVECNFATHRYSVWLDTVLIINDVPFYNCLLGPYLSNESFSLIYGNNSVYIDDFIITETAVPLMLKDVRIFDSRVIQ